MKKLGVIHPYLFATYPILFLYSTNIEHFPLSVIIVPLIVSLFITYILFALLTFLLKNKAKAGVLMSLLVFSFLSYGHWANFLDGNLYEDAVNFILWAVLLGLAFWLGYFFIKKPKKLTNILNFIAIILVVLPLINIIIGNFSRKVLLKNSLDSEISLTEVQSRPNIYYIVLDGYGRSDVLDELYEYDNSELIGFLDKKDFFVAHEATTNYNATALSLAAALNVDYIDNLFENIDTNSNNKNPLNQLIANSKVVDALKRNGYSFVAISSGYYATDLKNANFFLDSNRHLSEFDNAVANLTPIPVFLSVFSLSNDYTVISVHKRTVLSAFEQLENTSALTTPTFTLAHIITPHAPFVFGQDGEEIAPNQSLKGWDGNHLVGVGGYTKEDYIKDYRGQATYVSKRVQETIKTILQNSENPPVIILQSDHGPGSELDWESLENTNLNERFPILMAIYFPDQAYDNLYQSITPINSFRVILNQFAGTNYELLEDENYFSTYSKPYEFKKVTDKIE